MIPSITLVSEKGDFLAIDLGGTNLRVLHVRLETPEVRIIKQQKSAVPKNIMEGKGEGVTHTQTHYK